MPDSQTLLIGLMEVMESAIDAKDRDVFFAKFYQIRNIKVDKVTAKIVDTYKHLLLKSISQFHNDSSMNTTVSSIISLSYLLVPSDKLDTDLLKILTDCLDLTDTRIKSNALTAICEFDPNSELFKEHINSRFNRIAAEALIAEGKKALGPGIFVKLREFFSSSNPFFVASGIYVVGQLVEYYSDFFSKADNPYQSEFDFFIKKINLFSKHPHEMVRKRALMSKKLIEVRAEKKAG